LLCRFQDSQRARAEIVQLMMHICYRQFRLDSLNRIKNKEIVTIYQNKVEKDEIRLELNDLTKTLLNPPHLVSGQRLKLTQPAMLFQCLWTSAPGYQRKFFQYADFRDRASQAQLLLQQYPDLEQQWEARFEHDFWVFHPCILYPDVYQGSLISHAKSGARLWYATEIRAGKVEWAKGKGSQYVLPDYPTTLDLGFTELVEFLTAL
jgi:hypothetical protein